MKKNKLKDILKVLKVALIMPINDKSPLASKKYIFNTFNPNNEEQTILAKRKY